MAHAPGEAEYLRSIRNVAKRDYARAYADHLAFPEIIPEPSDPDRAALSYMAAQAVRLTLAGLHKAADRG
jgi:hypothetical protein